MADALLLQLTGLSKSFGAVRALRELTLALDGRAPTGLLGPNGAGKSTLISVLLGLTPPTAGTASVLGLDIARQPLAVRRRVGYLPEDDAYFDGMTGVEAATYAGELWGLGRRHALARAHDVLGYTGLSEARHRAVDGYSRGMRQRLKLAQALVGDPELLLLDEPATGLDPPGRAQMLELIQDLARHGKAVILSTHLLPDVERVCERVVLMGEGRLLASGSLAELTAAPAGEAARAAVRVKAAPERLQEALVARSLCQPSQLRPDGAVEVALPDPAATGPLFALAAELGLQIRRLEPANKTLEAVFLEQVEASREAAPDAAPAEGA